MSLPSLADAFAQYIGVKEYNGIVKTIQEWFYGTLIKQSWCATSVSYFCNKIGALERIGGKNENVKLMMDACKKYAESHDNCWFFDKKNIPAKLRKDDILFYLWDGTAMETTSNKHVSVCAEDTVSDIVPSIGGNQRDMIMVGNYPRSNLYAVYRYQAPEKNYQYIGWHMEPDGRWWYSDTLTSYYADRFADINGCRYHFDKDGYMETGHITVDGKRYFMEDTMGHPKEGAMMYTAEDGSLSIKYL